MPCTFFSHQAPVLPLKMARPRWFNGTALVIGSMAPDLEFALKGKTAWGIGHSAAGQFLFCLPITLLLVWIVTRIVARPLAVHLPEGGSFHLRDYQALEKSSRRAGYWLKAVPCALLGSFSHIAWDSFTHTAGWSAQRLGYAGSTVLIPGGHHLLLCKLLQHGSTLVGGILTLLMLWQIGKNRCLLRWNGISPSEVDAPTSSASHCALWLPVVGLTLLGLLISAWLAHQAQPSFPLHSWKSGLLGLLFRTSVFAFAGLCLGSILCQKRWMRQREPPRPA